MDREQGTGSRSYRPRIGVQGTGNGRPEAGTHYAGGAHGLGLSELATSPEPPSATIRQGHLALLKRWYYRPEAKRTGEIFFPDTEGRWPVKALLRGVGRIAAKSLGAAATP